MLFRNWKSWNGTDRTDLFGNANLSSPKLRTYRKMWTTNLQTLKMWISISLTLSTLIKYSAVKLILNYTLYQLWALFSRLKKESLIVQSFRTCVTHSNLMRIVIACIWLK
jgi:hypothetical protein